MKTRNIAFGALIAVLVMALWYNFLLKPSRADAKKVKAEVETEKAKLPPLQAQLAQANNDAAHAGTFKAQLAALKHALPDSPELANFIRDANAVAAASNIEWQSVSHSEPTPGADGIATITLGIQVKGTYEQVLDYLTRMSALKRLVVIDGLQFNGAGAGAGGAAAGPGASTGPFSGASALSVTITARMFETPPELAVATAPADTSTADAGTASSS
jgi:type IV pilus assembly protein PilO